MAVRHKVSLTDPNAHLITVSTTFTAEPGGSLPNPLVAAMPVWTPGSYLVREFARCVEGARASADGKEIAVRKERKNAWAIEHGGASEVTLTYELYCNDLSVRTNHVDGTHLFLNGAATFTFAAHAPQQGAELTLELPESWKVSTSLARAGTNPRVLVAKDYDELADAPVHAGHTLSKTFEVQGKQHEFAGWGEAPCAYWDEVVRDT